MCDKLTPVLHTIVCNECDPHHHPNGLSHAFLELIRQHVERDRRRQSEFADVLGISRRTFARILAGKRPMTLRELRTLTDLLDIDRALATVAIEVIGDWRAYDDPGLSILLRLIRPVVTKLDQRADFPIERLTDHAEQKVANWLADMLIANEEQIRHRRNEFIERPRI